MALPFTRSARWVFVGDSITDTDWRDCPDQIGSGYVRFIRDWLRASRPADAPEVLNRGISGNKIPDLQARWDADILAHRPDLVSIKIGINDVWHGLQPSGRGTAIADFVSGYREILTRLKTAFPQVEIVLCEPSVIWPPAPAEGNAALVPYVEAVHALAGEFQARAVVPLHRVFNEARAARPDLAWAPDGVHPSSFGHMLIARSWLAALGLL